MKKIRINVNDITRDITADMSDDDLMRKYGLSRRHLLLVKKKLLENKLITAEDLSPNRKQTLPPYRKIDAKDFIRDFLEHSDDYFLMQRYSLQPKHLRKVYDQLIKKDLLSEYELHSRDRKAPELEEEPTKPVEAASTVVSFVEGAPTRIVGANPQSDWGPPRSMFTDYSGVKLGNAEDFSSQPEMSHPTKVQAPSTVVDVRTCEYCPNCRAPKEPRESSCLKCGIIFEKYYRMLEERGTAPWDDQWSKR